MHVHPFTILILFITILNSCTNKARNDKYSKIEVTDLPASKPDGAYIYRTNCVSCHGINGNMGINGAANLTISALPLQDRLQVIANGKGIMTPFESTLSPEEIQAVAEHTFTLKR